MADKLPTPVNGGTVDANTLATIRHQPPGASGFVDRLTHTVFSPEAGAVVDTAVGNVGQLSYDAFVRKYVCEPAAQAISKQGAEFVRHNVLNTGQAAEWVNAQRNALLASVRDERNSPLGRAVSEYLKSRDKLPSVEDLAKKYGGKVTEEKVFEAMVRSGARTRGSINKLTCALRWSGPVMVLVEIGVSAHLVAEAPADQRGCVAAREAGGLLGGAAVGAWFEDVGAAPGCAFAAAAGGLGLGWAGSTAASWLGERTFDWTHTFVNWVTK